MHETSPTSAHMCELEPPISAVPYMFITGLKLMELSVSIKYLQEDILWYFRLINHWYPKGSSKTTTERPVMSKTYQFVRSVRARTAERVSIIMRQETG